MPHPFLPSAQIAAAGLLWGTTGIVVPFLHRATGLDAVAISFYRLAIAAVVLGPLLIQRRQVLRQAPFRLLAVGVGLGAYQALYFVAVQLGGVAVATVVSLGSAPVLIAVWEKSRSRSLWISMAAAVTGLILIAGGDATPNAAGLLAALASGFGYAATTVLSRHLCDRVDPMTLTASSTVVGGLALALPAVLLGGLGFPLHEEEGAMLLYLGVATTAVAYTLFYAGLRSTRGSAATVLTLLEPLTAAVLAVLLLGEPLTVPMVAGSVLMLGAVAGVK
ncbi:EamA family transporter [Winogradskya consettensis]|uniref:Membrane protein n=1 Tax=Winogradskya consettensis TaxID=113560 RepID=A0A919W026_9ACTN|nr:EamA family transporter [Actinoplanes consettensis]GIM80950.1 membrane protein [Actinoplanes consettensis]